MSHAAAAQPALVCFSANTLPSVKPESSRNSSELSENPQLLWITHPPTNDKPICLAKMESCSTPFTTSSRWSRAGFAGTVPGFAGTFMSPTTVSPSRTGFAAPHHTG